MVVTFEMRLLVVDPQLLLRGALVRESRARRLLVLLYYGHEANFVRLYETGGRTLVDPHQSRTLETGGPSYGRLVAAAEDRTALLVTRLPSGMPDDLGLALSLPMLPLLDRGAKQARSVVPDIDSAAVRHRVLSAVAVLAAIDESESTRGWQSWTRRRPREITPDRAVLLATAAAVEGSLVVSDDRELADEEDRPAEYVDPRSGAQITVVRLDLFIDKFAGIGTGFDEIEPTLIEPGPVFGQP